MHSKSVRLTDWEQWACANSYVTRYQEDTPVPAAMRCDELLEQGDTGGVCTYHAIVERIHKLLEQSPNGRSLH